MLLASTLLFALSASASPLLETRQASTRFSPAGGNKANWETLGCAMDKYPDARILTSGYTESSKMTIGTCLNYCSSQGTHLAGLENGNQCFCGADFRNGGSIQTNSTSLPGKCTSNANGNSNQSGGGANSLLVFQSKVNPIPTQPRVNNTSFAGCYPDAENKRLLPNSIQVSGAMTNQKCLTACTAKGYDLCGTEFRNQCFGGNSQNIPMPKMLDSTRCEYSCEGDTAQVCGGAGALSIYLTQPAPAPSAPSAPSPIVVNGTRTYSYKGCYTDRSDSQGRALTGRYSSSSKNTNEACVTTCSNNGFKYAATENGNECRCGNSLASFSKNTATCDVTCPGNSTTSCGGSNYAMTLYQLQA